MAAVISRKVPIMTIIGDTVNVSARMETNSLAQRIHVSQPTAELVSSCPEFQLTPRGVLEIKGKVG